ncbi:MAG: TIR domain-containing protein [Rubrivivax sp.]|nr:TIR domain-containing protein [Rubrivivax sp.]
MSTSDAPRVFLSYARPDAHLVEQVYARLVDEGFNVWMDTHSIFPGQEWELEIESALRDSSVVLVCLSRNSVTREGYLQKEILAALEVWKHKPPHAMFLIPAKLEPCDVHPRLRDFHWVDLFDAVSWRRLLTQLAGRLRDPGATVPARLDEQSDLFDAPLRDRDPPGAPGIPVVTFPETVKKFAIDSIGKPAWDGLSDATKRVILTLGCKLEPVVQIVPPTPVPIVLGFECLGLGALGENFFKICEQCHDADPGLIRICLAIVAIQTTSSLREEAIQNGYHGARNLIFSINLDPAMIESPFFRKFLKWFHSQVASNVVFEVNETTTKQYLARLKNLQVDFDLRFSADDLNAWHPEVRSALIDRVEMTKMDYRSFIDAMEMRGDDKDGALARLLAHNVIDKPLIVEGVQDEDYIEFLQRHWDFKKYGHLYGQGHILDTAVHWNKAIRPLRDFGTPGGSFLERPDSAPPDPEIARLHGSPQGRGKRPRTP